MTAAPLLWIHCSVWPRMVKACVFMDDTIAKAHVKRQAPSMTSRLWLHGSSTRALQRSVSASIQVAGCQAAAGGLEAVANPMDQLPSRAGSTAASGQQPPGALLRSVSRAPQSLPWSRQRGALPQACWLLPSGRTRLRQILFSLW